MINGINIAVIGLGNIGEWVVSKLCMEALHNNLAVNRIVCIGTRPDKIKSKISDIIQSLLILESQYDRGAICNLINTLSCSTNFEQLDNIDYIITTYSTPMNESIKNRSDLLFSNDMLTQKIAFQMSRFIPDHCRIINITNPLDIITWRLQQLSKLPVEQVVGVSGQIDSARFMQGINEIAGIHYLSIDQSSIHILGEHGPTAVPILSQMKINQQSISNLLDHESIEKIKDYALTKGTQMKCANQNIPPHIAIARAAVNCLKSWESPIKSTMPLCYWSHKYQAYLGSQVHISESGITPTNLLESLTSEETKALDFSAMSIIQDYLKLNNRHELGNK